MWDWYGGPVGGTGRWDRYIGDWYRGPEVGGTDLWARYGRPVCEWQVCGTTDMWDWYVGPFGAGLGGGEGDTEGSQTGL
jgi:hypothetical protein